MPQNATGDSESVDKFNTPGAEIAKIARAASSATVVQRPPHLALFRAPFEKRAAVRSGRAAEEGNLVRRLRMSFIGRRLFRPGGPDDPF